MKQFFETKHSMCYLYLHDLIEIDPSELCDIDSFLMDWLADT